MLGDRAVVAQIPESLTEGRGVKQGSCLAGDGRKENPFVQGRMVTATHEQRNTSGAA